jgi:hypothetical protein
VDGICDRAGVVLAGACPEITAGIISRSHGVYTTRPNSQTTRITDKDMDTKAGKSWHYLRVFQRDTENPAGDPEIAWTSPWYVTYQ